ncbi:hypothetical protein BB561_006521, partial [Smittium simulii]
MPNSLQSSECCNKKFALTTSSSFQILRKINTASENILNNTAIINKEKQQLSLYKKYGAPTPNPNTDNKLKNVEKLNNFDNVAPKVECYNRNLSAKSSSKLKSKSTDNLAEKYQKSYMRHKKDIDAFKKFGSIKNSDSFSNSNSNASDDIIKNKYKNPKHENKITNNLETNPTEIDEFIHTKSLNNNQKNSAFIKTKPTTVSAQHRSPSIQSNKYNKHLPPLLKETRSKSSLSSKPTPVNYQSSKSNQIRPNSTKKSNASTSSSEFSQKNLYKGKMSKDKLYESSKSTTTNISQKNKVLTTPKAPTNSNVSSIVQKLQKSQNNQAIPQDPSLNNLTISKSYQKIPAVSERLLELSKSRPRRLNESIKQRKEIAKKEVKGSSIYRHPLKREESANKSPNVNNDKVECYVEDYDIFSINAKNSSLGAQISKHEKRIGFLASYQQKIVGIDKLDDNSYPETVFGQDKNENTSNDIIKSEEYSNIYLKSTGISQEKDSNSTNNDSPDTLIKQENVNELINNSNTFDNSTTVSNPTILTITQHQTEKIQSHNIIKETPSKNILYSSVSSLPSSSITVGDKNHSVSNLSTGMPDKHLDNTDLKKFKTPTQTTSSFATELHTNKKYNTLSGFTRRQFSKVENFASDFNSDNDETTSYKKKFSTLKPINPKPSTFKINNFYKVPCEDENDSNENEDFIIIKSPKAEAKKSYKSNTTIDFDSKGGLRSLYSNKNSDHNLETITSSYSTNKVSNLSLESFELLKSENRKSSFFDTCVNGNPENNYISWNHNINKTDIKKDSQFYHSSQSCSQESLISAKDSKHFNNSINQSEINDYNDYENIDWESKISFAKIRKPLHFPTRSFDQSISDNFNTKIDDKIESFDHNKRSDFNGDSDLQNNIMNLGNISSRSEVENYLNTLILKLQDQFQNANSDIKDIISLHKKDYTNERKNVLIEISESESSYLSDLYLLREVYYRCDDFSNTNGNTGFSDSDQEIIFGNLDQIINITEQLIFFLLQSIENEIFEKQNTLKFYHIFDFLADVIEKTYSVYCSNFPVALSRLSCIIDIDIPGDLGIKSPSSSAVNLQNTHVISLDSKLLKDLPKSLNRRKVLKSSKKLKSSTNSLLEFSEPNSFSNLCYSKSVIEFLNLQQKKLVGKTLSWDLRSLLIKPVQRVLKYHLLLNRLSEMSPNEPAKFYELTASRYVLLAEKVNTASNKNELSFPNISASRSLLKSNSMESSENSISNLLLKVGNSNLKSKNLLQNTSEDINSTNSAIIILLKRLLNWIDHLNLILKSIHGWEDAFREFLFQINIHSVAFSNFLTDKSTLESDNNQNEQYNDMEFSAKKSNDSFYINKTSDDFTLLNHDENSIYAFIEGGSMNYTQYTNILLQEIFSSAVHQSLKRKAYIPTLQLIKICLSVRKFFNNVLTASQPNTSIEHQTAILSRYSLTLDDAILLLEKEVPKLIDLQTSAVEVISESLKYIQQKFYYHAIDLYSVKANKASANCFYSENLDFRLAKPNNSLEYKNFKSINENPNMNWVESNIREYTEQCKFSDYNFLCAKNSPSNSNNNDLNTEHNVNLSNNTRHHRFPSSNECNLYLREISKIFATATANVEPNQDTDYNSNSLKKQPSSVEPKLGFLAGKSSSLVSKLVRVTSLFPGVNKSKSTKTKSIKKSVSTSRKSSSILSSFAEDIQITRSRISSRASMIINSSSNSNDQSDRVSLSDKKIIMKNFFKLPVFDLAEFVSLEISDKNNSNNQCKKKNSNLSLLESRYSNSNLSALALTNYKPSLNGIKPINSDDTPRSLLRNENLALCSNENYFYNSLDKFKSGTKPHANHSHKKSVISLGTIEHSSFSTPVFKNSARQNSYQNLSKLANNGSELYEPVSVSSSQLFCISTKLSYYGGELFGMSATRCKPIHQVVDAATRTLAKCGKLAAMVRLRQELSMTDLNIKTAVARTRAFGKWASLRTWISVSGVIPSAAAGVPLIPTKRTRLEYSTVAKTGYIDPA